MARVKDVMVAGPVAARVPSTQRDLLKLFLRHGHAGFPVVKEGANKLVGVVTRRDLLRNPDEVQVALLMDPNAATTYPESPLGEAARLLVERQLRLLPVVNAANELLGVVTPRELLGELDHARGLVSPYLPRHVVPVHRSTPAPVAWEILRVTGIGALPVLDDRARLAGIITDGDLLRRAQIGETRVQAREGLVSEGDEWDREAIRGARPQPRAGMVLTVPDRPVAEFAVSPVRTARENTTLREAARTMAAGHLNQLPVLDAEERVVDLLKDLDVVAALAR